MPARWRRLRSRSPSGLSFRSTALLAVGVAWLLLRVVYWNGYYTEDAPGYVTDAIYIALGEYRARDHVNGLNIGTYAPVALPLWVFGKSEVALSVWPMACSLLGMTSIAGASTVLFGRWFGVLAAALYATYPGDVFFSTVVMPDAPQAGWLSCAIFLVVLSFAGPAWRKYWLLAAGGVAVGVCHLIRANDIVLVPVGLAAVAICSRVWKGESVDAQVRSCGVFLTGCAAVYVIEGLAYLWAAGDFLLRLHVVTRHYGTAASIAEKGLNTDLRTLPFSLFPPIVWWIQGGWGELNQDQAYHGLLFCAAALALAAGGLTLAAGSTTLADRTRAACVLAAFWLVWPLVYHEFGSQSLFAYVPMHRLSRHFVVYAPGAIFAVVAGCYMIVAAARSWQVVGLRAAAAAVACAMLVVHWHVNWRGEQIAYGAYQRIKQTYGRIRGALPPDVHTIVGDPGDLCFFDFWLNPLGGERVKMVAFANYSGCDDIGRSAVLTYSNPGWDGLGAPVIRETVERLPCLIRPPDGWQLLYDGYPEKVYLIGEHKRRAWNRQDIPPLSQ